MLDYAEKRKIEEVFASYLQAMEHQDQQEMERIWRRSDQDRLYSVFGVFEGSAIVQELMDRILPMQIQVLRIGRSTMQVLFSSPTNAMVQAEYEVAAALAQQEGTALRTLLETQQYEKTDDGWKLAYIHQSWMPEHALTSPESRMEQALSGMLEWVAKAKQKTLDRPKTTAGRIALLAEELSTLDQDPDEAYLAMQEIFLQERKKLRDLKIVPVDQEEPLPQVLQQPASLIAAEAVLGFLPQNSAWDALLSLDAGIELQRDIQAIQSMKPRPLLELDGYHLPVKAIFELTEAPVYGLYTRAKQQHMEAALKQALQRILQQGHRSLVISAGWHQQLHLPLDFADTLAAALQELPAGSFDTVVLQAERNDERKALEQAVERQKAAAEALTQDAR